jgi:hypothetical protein
VGALVRVAFWFEVGLTGIFAAVKIMIIGNQFVLIFFKFFILGSRDGPEPINLNFKPKTWIPLENLLIFSTIFYENTPPKTNSQEIKNSGLRFWSQPR